MSVVGAVFAATTIQTIAGMGFALMAVPWMSLVVEPRDAVVIATVVGLMSMTYQGWVERSSADVGLARRLILSSLVGAPVGLVVIVSVSAQALRLALGVVVLFAVGALWRGYSLAASARNERVMGFFSGVLGTSLATNGPPLAILLHGRDIGATTFRSTLTQVFAVANVVAIVLFAVTGVVTSTALVLSMFSLPAAAVGIAAGSRLRRGLSEERFRGMVLVLLVASGTSAILGAVL